jgi:hypothetical protein
VKLNDDGTAILTLFLPGAGKLVISGKGFGARQAPRAVRARFTKSVQKAGTVKVKIAPKGKVRKKLNQKGKAKVKVKIAFTPEDGVAGKRTRTLKLKKQLR